MKVETDDDGNQVEDGVASLVDSLSTLKSPTESDEVDKNSSSSAAVDTERIPSDAVIKETFSDFFCGSDAYNNELVKL